MYLYMFLLFISKSDLIYDNFQNEINYYSVITFNALYYL